MRISQNLQNPFDRYTAKEALEHPWITRMSTTIPLTYSETIAWNESRIKLCNVFTVCFLSAKISLSERRGINKIYEKKLIEISDFVSKWDINQLANCICDSIIL